MPKRIQRKRTKGWRMPENAVYVGRPTRWGNPYIGEGAACVDAYRKWIHDRPHEVFIGPTRSVRSIDWKLHDNRNRESALHFIYLLRGCDLACWCPLDQPCHADVLLELANQRVEAE